MQTPNTKKPTSAQGGYAPAGSAVSELRRVSSAELFGERRELVIEHDGREYRLRLTQNGKLILTA